MRLFLFAPRMVHQFDFFFAKKRFYSTSQYIWLRHAFNKLLIHTEILLFHFVSSAASLALAMDTSCRFEPRGARFTSFCFRVWYFISSESDETLHCGECREPFASGLVLVCNRMHTLKNLMDFVRFLELTYHFSSWVCCTLLGDFYRTECCSRCKTNLRLSRTRQIASAMSVSPWDDWLSAVATE